jgi:hypothetical protein
MEFKGILRHRQLVIGGIIGQEQTRAYFARNAHVHLPDVTALCSATGPFLRLHPVQHGEAFAGDVVAKSLWT